MRRREPEVIEEQSRRGRYIAAGVVALMLMAAGVPLLVTVALVLLGLIVTPVAWRRRAVILEALLYRLHR